MRTNPKVPALVAGLMIAGAAIASAAPQTRAFRHAFPQGSAGATELRLANLAGRIELVRGQGKEVVIDATVHAEAGGETQSLLQGMKWVKSRDREGREEWVLSYPVEKHRTYHYPRAEKEEDDSIPGFLKFLDHSQTSTTYRGVKVRVHARKSGSTPSLWADLKIALPAGSHVAVRNVVGSVRGGDLEGTLTVDTGSGDVRIASHSGHLSIDTGSGGVFVNSAKGETSIDTGSGDVVVRRLVGNGAIDTGSGSIVVENISAGRLAVETGSGDVTVKQGMAARVIAETSSGSVNVLGVELEELDAETGSGDVIVQSSLAKARRVTAETGSGSVRIKAGPNASFDIASDHGSGQLVVGYDDATLRKEGNKIVGAKRGDGRTVIRVETGSGDCVITPKPQS
jgi:hypothetical protein